MTAKTWDELYGEGANDSAIAAPQTPLTEAQLADRDFLRQLCTKELAAIVQGNKGNVRGVPAISALWDRIDGKPSQTVQQEVTVKREPMSDLELAKAVLFYTRPAVFENVDRSEVLPGEVVFVPDI